MQRQHGIKYSLDVTRCMFSSGNVTERARMGRQACQDQVVVDLFAGIGYFTLPMLVQAGMASLVRFWLFDGSLFKPWASS